MKYNIEIKGLSRLVSKWESAPENIKKMVMDALMRSGYMVERESKLRTPVRTGRLRTSISVSSSLALRAEPHVVISPHTTYATFVHEGTRFMKARPFMMLGYNKAKNAIKNEMKQVLSKVVKELK